MSSTFHRSPRRFRRGALGLAVAATLVATSAAAWSATADGPQAAQQTTQAQTPQGRVFGSDAGMIFNPVKPGAAADFELVMGKLKEALGKSQDPIRQEQAKSWKIFKALEPMQDTVLYVFVVDPAVKGADYSVSKILAEAFPIEVQTLYEKLGTAYALAPSLINLSLVQALGQGSGMSELNFDKANK